MDKYYKNKINKLIIGVTILVINYIINYYSRKITIMEKFDYYLGDLIKIFKFSFKISIFYTIIWYICCIFLFNNKKTFSKLLELNSPIFVRHFTIIEIIEK